MTEPDPLDYVTWDEPTGIDADARFTPDSTPVPEGRPTEWNGKPIPENALWEEDGITPLLTPTGRVRRSRGARAKTDKPGKKSSSMSAAARTQLAEDLLDPIAKGALGLSFTAPTVGAVLIERGEKTANAFVALAANSPRMLRALERASKVGPAADLVETAVMIFVALQLDTGSMQPTSPIAHMTGVGALHMSINPGAQDRRGATAERPTTAPPFTGGTDGPLADPFVPPVPPFTVKDEPTDPLDPEHSQYSFRAPVSAAAVTPMRGGPFGSPFPSEDN